MNDPATLATVLGLATTLVAAVAYALRKRADADRERAKATRLEGEAGKLRAEAEVKKADATGKVLIGAEADAEQIREAFRDMRARLDRCEKRHEDCEARIERNRLEYEDRLVAKQAQIDALWKELVDVRRAIDAQAGR